MTRVVEEQSQNHVLNKALLVTASTQKSSQGSKSNKYKQTKQQVEAPSKRST